MKADTVSALLLEGAAEGVYPAAQAVVLHQGKEVFNAAVGDARVATLFDLASVTKVMSTTAIFMKLWAEGVVGPQTELRRFFPDAAVAGVGATLGDLLCHRSGLPAFVPFFVPVLRAVPELYAVDCPPSARLEVRDEVVARAAKVEPIQEIGATAIYSDVGFILLGEALARAANTPLDALFLEKVARPLGLSSRFHRLSTLDRSAAVEVAPTGRTRPREHAPGQESLWEAFPPVPSPPGEVDDDNAFVMDGVAGHAGLFGTAADLARFGQAVLEELDGAGRLAPGVLWQRALTKDPHTPGSSRTFGFDTPTSIETGAGVQPSMAGSLIGNRPPGAVGHLGFTGTSLWIDRARALVVALCTNRTATGRSNMRIRAFRPRFHDAVVEALGL